MEKLVSRDDLVCTDEMEVLQGVISWGSARCESKKLPVSGKNLSAELGNLIYRVRFPLLSVEVRVLSPLIPCS
jgi:hypothetical protein